MDIPTSLMLIFFFLLSILGWVITIFGFIGVLTVWARQASIGAMVLFTLIAFAGLATVWGTGNVLDKLQ